MKDMNRKLIILSISLFFIPLLALNIQEECMKEQVANHRPTSCDVTASQVWILVHGTYAKNGKWYQVGGDFYEELKASLSSSAQIYSFAWSGNWNHKARIKAAEELADFIETHTEPKDIINIVGHSHGATVIVLAANILKEKESKHHIAQLFSLAPPVYRDYYAPDMKNIDYLFNIFSFGDLVQSIFGRAQRVYTEHAQIWNIEMKKDGVCPDHSDIHCREIAQLLPQLQGLVKGNNTTVLHLQTGKEHIFEDDFERDKWLALDRKKSQNILRMSIEGIRKKYPQKILLKVMRISYEKLNAKTKKLTSSRWYYRFRNRRD